MTLAGAGPQRSVRTARVSASRAPRSAGDPNGSPSAANSASTQPAPRPRTRRPLAEVVEVGGRADGRHGRAVGGAGHARPEADAAGGRGRRPPARPSSRGRSGGRRRRRRRSRAPRRAGRRPAPASIGAGSSRTGNGETWKLMRSRRSSTHGDGCHLAGAPSPAGPAVRGSGAVAPPYCCSEPIASSSRAIHAEGHVHRRHPADVSLDRIVARTTIVRRSAVAPAVCR